MGDVLFVHGSHFDGVAGKEAEVAAVFGCAAPDRNADELPEPAQVAVDEIEEASMESFPCSDPPAYTMRHV